MKKWLSGLLLGCLLLGGYQEFQIFQLYTPEGTVDVLGVARLLLCGLALTLASVWFGKELREGVSISRYRVRATQKHPKRNGRACGGTQGCAQTNKLRTGGKVF